jgi:hypothetical protein
MTKMELENLLRVRIMNDIKELLSEKYDTEMYVVGSGKLAFYTIDAEANDKSVKVEISIPRGTRNNAGGYDEYDCAFEAEAYRLESDEKAAKKAAIAEKKARDAEQRKQKALEREAKKKKEAQE